MFFQKIPDNRACRWNASPGLNPGEQAAMEEIRRRLKEDAEVICVIRSRRNPQTKSEVIMLDKASPEFLQQLAAETQSQAGRQETSLEFPAPNSLPWNGLLIQIPTPKPGGKDSDDTRLSPRVPYLLRRRSGQGRKSFNLMWPRSITEASPRFLAKNPKN